MRVLTLIMLGRVLEKTSRPQPKKIWDIRSLKHNKPWFDDECSKLIDQRKQAKLQWLQNPSQTNKDNLQNVRHETSRIFRNKKREHLKAKINELEASNKTKTLEICTEA
jgi:hypothetical protein